MAENRIQPETRAAQFIGKRFGEAIFFGGVLARLALLNPKSPLNQLNILGTTSDPREPHHSRVPHPSPSRLPASEYPPMGIHEKTIAGAFFNIVRHGARAVFIGSTQPDGTVNVTITYRRIGDTEDTQMQGVWNTATASLELPLE